MRNKCLMCVNKLKNHVICYYFKLEILSWHKKDSTMAHRGAFVRVYTWSAARERESVGDTYSYTKSGINSRGMKHSIQFQNDITSSDVHFAILIIFIHSLSLFYSVSLSSSFLFYDDGH